MTNYHRPVLLEECIDGLNIDPKGIYVDVTFGGGGHSRAILEKLGTGTLIGFDQDEDAKKNIPDDKRFIFVQHNFRYLKRFLRYHSIDKIDGLLADLGVSSHHLNEAERGFAFRFNGPVDMRMNRQSALSARSLLNDASQEELQRIFKNYGELPSTYKMTSSIVAARGKGAIETVDEFLQIIHPYVPKKGSNQFLAKVFQAIRIEVNQEIEVLKEMLSQAAEVLKPEGRLVVISYHSLEDRLVKNFIRDGNFEGKADTDLFGRRDTLLKAVNNKVIIPSDEEMEKNNRARSAKLRIAVRTTT